MNNTELLLEYVDQINSDRLETEQEVINNMIQESFKEWEYLDHCIKYNKEPTEFLQEVCLLVSEHFLRETSQSLKLYSHM